MSTTSSASASGTRRQSAIEDGRAFEVVDGEGDDLEARLHSSGFLLCRFDDAYSRGGGELWSRCGGRRSPVDHPLVRFRVAGALRLDLYLVDLAELVGRQFEVGRGEVLLEPVQLGGARDRH